MMRITARLCVTATLTIAIGVMALPAQPAAAANPQPADLLCDTLGLCLDTVLPVPVPLPELPLPAPTPATEPPIDVVLPPPGDEVVAPVENLLTALVPIVNETTTMVFGQPAVTGTTQIAVTPTAPGGVTANVISNTNVVVGDLATVSLNSVNASAAVSSTNGVVVITDGNAIADLPLGGATGNSLPGSTLNLDLCGAPVVVGGTASQRCGPSSPTSGSAGNTTPGAVLATVSTCGLQVVAAGSSSTNCTTSGGNQTGGAADSLFPILNANVVTDLCGVQVVLLGSADADCAGTPAGVSVGACARGLPIPCGDIVDLTVPLCGTAVAVLATASANCSERPVDTTDPTTDPTPGPTPGADGPGSGGPTGPGPDETASDLGAPSGFDAGTDVGEGIPGATPSSPSVNSQIVASNPSGGGLLSRDLPFTGMSVGSLLVVACALLVMGNVARRVHATPVAAEYGRRATDRRR